MKKLFWLFAFLFITSIAHAENILNTSSVKMSVLTYDANGDKISDQNEILRGKDKFLVKLAKPEDLTNARRWHITVDKTNYTPVTLDELILLDQDSNQALTANELDHLGIRIASYLPGTEVYKIATLADEGISYLRLYSSNAGVSVQLLPTRGSAAIKVYPIEMSGR